ncbi:MAG: hypothetical protein JO362_14180, partial [Streptomycetaceae bacterium]|nr:hypothetical protein [Streptomycetaceae bacterium]
LTHTQPALADTPGPSDPLQHHLPPNWLKNLHRDLVGKNHRAKSGRLTNALRALIQTTCLKPGTYLSGREAIRQLARLKIHPGTVWKAYAQLGDEGLLITKRTGTWVAGPAESPASARPAEWLEQLQREMEDDRWFEQVLRTHILRLQPHTPLPPHGELAELLEIPEISETFVLNAYDRLTEDGLLVRNSHNNPQVADHGGPVHPAMGWQASQTAGTVLPDAGDPEPELPDDWIKTLQRELENNPPPHREKITCLTRALERHIQNLKYQTRLPSNRDLAKQLKSAWINYSIVQKAYAHLKKTGQLTSEFGNGQGTWVAQPRNVMDSATGPGLPQARREHSEPPLPPDPFLDIPEPDETYPWEFREIWDVLDGKEPRPTPPVVPGAELDPQTERAAQATGHLTDLSYLPSPDVHPDVCDILNLLNPDGSITAMHPDLWHLP